MRSRIKPNAYGLTPQSVGLHMLPCPPSWALQSLLVTIFLCLPLGVVALYYSSKVEERYALGRYDDAVKASNRAKTFMTWGTYVGAAIWLVVGWLWLTGSLHSSLLTFTV